MSPAGLRSPVEALRADLVASGLASPEPVTVTATIRSGGGSVDVLDVVDGRLVSWGSAPVAGRRRWSLDVDGTWWDDLDAEQVTVVDDRGARTPLPPCDLTSYDAFTGLTRTERLDLAVGLELTDGPCGAVHATAYLRDGQVHAFRFDAPDRVDLDVILPFDVFLRYRVGEASLYAIFDEGGSVNGSIADLQYVAGLFEFPTTHAAIRRHMTSAAPELAAWSYFLRTSGLRARIAEAIA
ncbi:MAG: hypothetical protein U0V73_16695 [Acidimicrobiia bacterium]